MKKSIKKLITLIISTTTILSVSSVGANAEWKQDSTGWWYSTDTSWVTGWSQIDGKWYYFDSTGYMKTGWVQDGSKWYYLNSDGSMAVNTVTPDGYTVDSNGAWLTTIANTSITTSPSTITTTNTVTTPTVVTNTNSSSSSTSSSSSSSSSSTNDYMTIFYDDNYNIKGVTSGLVNDPIGETDSKGNSVTFKILQIKLSDYNLTKDEFKKQIFNNYELQNNNGTITLVKKTLNSDSSSSSSSSDNNTLPTQSTTPSAVTVTTSSAVTYNG